MKSSVLFALAGTVCCLAGVASAQVTPTSPVGQTKSAVRATTSGVAVTPAKSTGHTEGTGFVDDCGSAPTVAEGTYAFDTSAATNDFAGLCGLTDTAPDMWVRYVATDTGLATATACTLSGSDTVLSIVDGCGGTSLFCNDDFCGLQSQISFPATAGNAYYIRVAGFNAGVATGSITISNAGGGGGGGPANDHCADATAVTDGTYDFDTTTADTDGASSCGFNTGFDVWYKYTAASDGQIQASTCNLVGFDTVLTAFDGCGGAELACLDDFCGLQTQLRVPVLAGQEVYFRMAGYNQNFGAGQINFSFVTPCNPTQPVGAVQENEACQSDLATDANGGCNDPELEVQSGLVLGDSVWGTASTYINPGDGLQYRDTDWYEFTADGANEITVTGSAAFPLRIFILDTNCPPGVIATAASTGDCTEVSVTGLAGSTFRVFAGLDGFTGLDCDAGVDNHYWITVTGSPVTPPGNDNCADAVVVTDGVYDYDNSLATTDGAASCGGSGNDVWYSYTAASDGVLNVTTCNLTGMDTVISAFAGCGGAELACNDDTCGLQSAINVPVVTGDTVLVAVAGFGGGRGSGQVQFTLGGPCNIVQPSGAVQENEDCQSDLATDANGGCNDPELEVQTVSYDSAIWGTASTYINPGDGLQYRDTDWYEFDFAGGTMEISGQAQFNLRLFVLDNLCPPTILFTAAGTGPCQDVAISADLPAGTYRVFAGLDGFTGLDCGGATDNHYILNIGNPVSCIADFNGDGFLDFFDYDDFVNCFETGVCPPGRTADVNGDDFVDFFDYDDFVAAFEVGC